MFGDRLYVELQRHGTAAERAVEPALIELAYAGGIPLVAANEPFFARRDDYEAHDALICIAEGRLVAETDRRQLTAEHYFKSRAEMAALFADLPEALASTVEIAAALRVPAAHQRPILPRFSVGDRNVDEGAELQQTRRGGPRPPRRASRARSRPSPSRNTANGSPSSIKVIEGMKYPGYFLIVSDFIQWAKEQGIPVGPGRGSGAGSLVAYALTITDLDPMRFDLLFERFLNPERVSMPDFDIDFCQDRRDEVIDYVQKRYGREQVAQIITFGTLQARGVLRDVGRVLEMPYGQVDKLCKLVPQNPAAPVTLAKAIEGEPRLQAERDGDPRVKRALRYCAQARGTLPPRLDARRRHRDRRPVRSSELVPLYRDPKSDMPVTQFSMKWVEQAGLVKFDFLGLKTLTVLDTAVKLLKQRNVELDLSAMPLDDKKTYDLLSRAEAVGIFQLESQGMRRALLDMRPDRFEDIIALVALYRPGPMANIPTYCARKHGREKPEYIHPKLEADPARDLRRHRLPGTGDAGGADPRRLHARPGRSAAPRDGQEDPLGDGRRSASISSTAPPSEASTARQADAIFDLLERFAEYGFNKSHAAAYALVAYQTAYLKANYPVEFLAASMTLDMGNTDKLSEFRAEAERLGIKVEPPSINRSGVAFDVDGNTIHYALAALKGVGAQAVEVIVEAQRRTGRSPTSPTSRAASIRARSTSACWKASPPPARSTRSSRTARAPSLRSIRVLATAQRSHEAASSGQNELFGGAANRETMVAPAGRGLAAGRPLRANTTPSASSCRAIRSTTTRRCSRA